MHAHPNELFWISAFTRNLPKQEALRQAQEVHYPNSIEEKGTEQSTLPGVDMPAIVGAQFAFL